MTEPTSLTQRPATYVDGWVIWPGGNMRRLTLWERILWRLGWLTTVRP